LEALAAKRNLTLARHTMNLDSLRPPQIPFLQTKLALFESMRKHEGDLKKYLKGKLINLKEDII